MLRYWKACDVGKMASEMEQAVMAYLEADDETLYGRSANLMSFIMAS
jgi:hypothetical protein